MRVIFAGTPDFAASALKKLLEIDTHIVAVYTQPDRKSGRGQKLQYSAVKDVAVQHDIPVEQPINFKDIESVNTLAEYNADLMIVAAYGLLLPKVVLDTPRLGCINIHASLLPRWRGAAPIQRAIQAGDNATGICIMQMDEGLDTGDVLLEKSIPIAPNETGGSLHDKLATLGADCIAKSLQKFDELNPVSQDNTTATYAKKISKREALIDWSKSAEDIERNIRAFKPWPVCFSQLANNTIRIHQASVRMQQSNAPPGTVLEITPEKLIVACGDGILDITKLQLPGGKALDIADVFNSKKDLFDGAVFD